MLSILILPNNVNIFSDCILFFYIFWYTVHKTCLLYTSGIRLFCDFEKKVTGLFLFFIKRMYLTSRIKCPDQFIYIMLKFSVFKQNTNLKQMDYTSFRNQLWWMHHAPDIPLCHPEVHQEACADFLQLLLYFLPENLFCPLSHKKQCHR